MLVFALLGVDQKKIDSVRESIIEIEGDVINKIYALYGEYDLLLKIKVVNAKKGREVISKITAMDGVNAVKTGVVAHQTHLSDVRPDKTSLA